MNLTKINDTFTSDLSYLNIGGFEFFLENLADYLPYTTISAMATVFGTFGNLVIIGSIMCTKELQTVTNSLILNLALSDLLISCLIDSFTVVGVLVGSKFFLNRQWFCEVLAAFCLIICVTSVYNMMFLALNRYFFICHRPIYPKVFSKKLAAFYFTITWIIGIAIDLPNFLGWGGHYFDQKSLNCLWNRLASQSYTIFFPTTCIILPCCLIAFFYYKIFAFAVEAKSRVKSRTRKQQNEFKSSFRIAKGLFASYALFTMCWLPYGIILLIDFEDRLPRTAHMYPIMLAHINSSLNPILYALTNSNFQKGYKNLFNLIFHRKKYKYSLRANSNQTT